MSKLLAIIKKNIQLLVMLKYNALVIFLLPIILVLLVGIAFSNADPTSINVGTFTNESGNITNNIIDNMNAERFFIKEENSKEQCINNVKFGETHICIVFPDDLSITDQIQTIEFYVDYNKANFVYDILDSIKEVIHLESDKISIQLTTELLSKITEAKSKIDITIKTINDTIIVYNENIDDLEKINSKLSNLTIEDLKNSMGNTDIQGDINIIYSDVVNQKNRLNQSFNELMGELNHIEDETNQSVNSDITNDLSDLIEAMDLTENKIFGSNESVYTQIVNLKKESNDKNTKVSELTQSREEINNELIDLISSLKTSIQSLENIKTQITQTKNILDSLTNNNPKLFASPINTKIEPITSKQTHFNTIFASLVVIVILITSLLFTSALVINEKFSKAYFRNMIMPVNHYLFSLGTFITSFIVITTQLAIFFIISTVLFHTQFIMASLPIVIITLFLSTSLFIVIGMIISNLFNSEASINLTNIFVFLMFLFFSDLILPIESMAFKFRALAYINPFMLTQEILKKTMFFNLGAGSLGGALLQLFIYFVEAVIILIIILIFHKIKIWFFFHGDTAKIKKTNNTKQKKYNNPYA